METAAEDNILFLKEAQKAIIEFETIQENCHKLSDEKLHLESQLSSEEKTVAADIAQTVKKRKEELTESFDKEIGQAQDRLKKIRAKKEKAKSLGKKERIRLETASLHEDNRKLKESNSTMIKQGKLPGICKRGWFYSIFMPSSFADYFITFLLLALLMFALPLGIYLLSGMKNPIVLSLMHFGVFLVIAVVTAFISSKVKYRNHDTLKQILNQRSMMRANNRKIHATTSFIRKDNSEEGYNLEDYNYDIAKQESMIEETGKKKQEALNTFEAVKRKVIEDEIRESSREKIQTLNEEIAKEKQALSEAEEQMNKLGMQLADRYGSMIGKENLHRDRIDALIKLLSEGEAKSLTDAVSILRDNKS